MVGHVADLFIAFSDNSNDFSFAGFHLLDIGNHFFIRGALGSNHNNWHVFVNQSNWAVFHFCRWIAFRMDIRNFFELERAFKGNWERATTAKIKRIGSIFVDSSNFFNIWVSFKNAFYFFWNGLEFCQ